MKVVQELLVCKLEQVMDVVSCAKIEVPIVNVLCLIEMA